MKFKKIPNECLPTILDRLTRFEPAYMRYNRVFNDIITRYSFDIKPKDLSIYDRILLAEKIIGLSIDTKINDSIKPYLFELERKYFEFNELSYQYLSSRINYSGIISVLDNNAVLPKNANFLRYISADSDIFKNRSSLSLLYPIEKILLCEGETEKILLPIIMNLYDINFDKLGILLIPAGGKNQVARKYYSMIEYVKLPFLVLLDKDANSTKDLINNKLRPIDTIYLINCGEFEDLIPVNILMGTINYIHNSEFHCLKEDFANSSSNVENIKNIYKKYGFGEYKKAHFANHLKSYIKSYCTKDDFKDTELSKIANFIKN